MQIFLANLFLIIPLFFWQGRYEGPKIMAFIFGSILLSIYWIQNIEKLKVNRADYWYFCWLITLIVSSLLGSDAKMALLGGSYRHQGVIFFFGLWLLIKFFENFKAKDYLRNLIGLIIVAESLYVLFVQKIGTIGETNAVAGLIAMGIMFVPKIALPFPVLAFLLNFSKSGFLAMVPYMFKKINILFIALIVSLIFVVKPINVASKFENRQVIWNHAINLIVQRPLLGYGAESNEVLFDKAFYESGFPLSNLIVDRAHNLFLDIGIWSGYAGLAFFAGFLIESYKLRSERSKQVFLSFLIYSMFQPLSVAHWVLFAIIL